MDMTRLTISPDSLAHFCRHNEIRKLSVFGSVLRSDFGPGSDVDVLVEFEPEARVGLIRFAGIELALSELLGRKVDLNTPGFLSPSIRSRVMSEAVVKYDGTR
jgi:uncharacterized protein